MHVSLVSNFIPRYGWLEAVESGTSQREFQCSLVLFVIGRCTRLGMLNSICHLLDLVCNLVRMEDVVISFRFDFAVYDAVISKEPYGRLNVFVYIYVIYVQQNKNWS